MNQVHTRIPGNISRWLFLILLVSVNLRLGMTLYLGDDTSNWLGGTADQLSYDNLPLRLLGGHGFNATHATIVYRILPVQRPAI